MIALTPAPRHQLCGLWLKSRLCGLKWLFTHRILQVLSGQKEAVPAQGTEDSSTFAASCVCHRRCLALLGLEYGAFSKPGQPCAAEQYSQLSDG